MQSENVTEDVAVDPAKLTESIKERVEGKYFIHIIKRNRVLFSVCVLYLLK